MFNSCGDHPEFFPPGQLVILRFEMKMFLDKIAESSSLAPFDVHRLQSIC